MSHFVQAKDVAKMANVDEKYFRAFLRDIMTDTPGRGGRYMIPETMINELLARFASWRQTRNGGRTVVVSFASFSDETPLIDPEDVLTYDNDDENEVI